MAELDNFDRLTKVLERLEAESKAKNHVTVQVGFTQRYAILVHEDLEANHPVGQAKYLEQPAREMQNALKVQIIDAVNKGRSLREALIMAGMHLQRASQELAPVDTSALRASAFTAVEEEADRAAQEAFNKSEQIRLNSQAKRKVDKYRKSVKQRRKKS